MTNKATRTLILIGIFAAMVLAVFWWKSSTHVGRNSSPRKSSSPAESSSSVLPLTTRKIDAPQLPAFHPSAPVSPRRSTPVIVKKAAVVSTERIPMATEALPTSSPAQLSAEAGLVTAGGISMKAIQALMKDEDFENRVERLAAQSLQEPLAIDLTALHVEAAADASQNVTGVEVQRIACGIQVCMATLSAPSLDAFQKWMAWFMSNPSVQVRSVSTGTSTLRDGSTEYRFFISTDSSVNRAFSASGG